MKPYIANLLTSLALLILGGWAYLAMAPDSRSLTVLIPVIFGVVLLTCTPWLKENNKIAAHVVVGLTLLIALALIMPLLGSLGRADADAIFRVGTMMLFAIVSLFIYIKDFIDVRKNKLTMDEAS